MNPTIGKYVSENTLIHRLDSRIKLVGLIIGLVSVFLNYGAKTPGNTQVYMNLCCDGVIFILVLTIAFIGKVSILQLFKQLSMLWSMVLFLLILNFFFPGNVGGDIAFHIGDRPVYYATIFNLVYILFRLVIVMLMTDIFTTTTKPMEMTGALEWLFYPLKLIHIPVHKFAMAISLALRFIPTLIEDANRIMKAQASRGVDYRQGSFKDRVKALVSLIIPLFMSSFMTSGELADAMEARGYDPDSKRTRYRAYTWSLRDTLSSLALALFLALVITEAVLRIDPFVLLSVPVPQLRG